MVRSLKLQSSIPILLRWTLAMISETDWLLGKDLFLIPSPANFEFYISQHDDMDIEKLPLNLCFFGRPKTNIKDNVVQF